MVSPTQTPALSEAPQWMWGNLGVVILVHGLALGAFFFGTFAGLLTCLGLIYLKGCLGIAAGYHRLICHKAFQAPRWVMYLLAFLGCMALQGGPIQWGTLHQLHHQKADTEKDPHSPVQKGLFWAHLGWTFRRYGQLSDYQLSRQYSRDIAHDGVLKWMNQHVLAIFLVSHSLIVAMAWIFGGLHQALSVLTLGCAVSAVYVWHGTGLVNSLCHRFGYRNFDTPDNSRNLWWVAALTFGEGWHNNHHGAPSSANFQVRCFEVDWTFWTIRGLALLGLARQIKDSAKTIKARSASI